MAGCLASETFGSRDNYAKNKASEGQSELLYLSKYFIPLKPIDTFSIHMETIFP